MTKQQLLAIEWALEVLGEVAIPEKFCATADDHCEALCGLFDSARKQYYAFDDSKVMLIAFMRKHAISIPQSEFDNWRVLPVREQRVGQINALPESRGIVRATNGILCYIEQSSGKVYGPAHLEFFEPDEQQAVRITHSGKPKKESLIDKFLTELFAS